MMMRFQKMYAFKTTYLSVIVVLSRFQTLDKIKKHLFLLLIILFVCLDNGFPGLQLLRRSHYVYGGFE